jgi:hypothetical protein
MLVLQVAQGGEFYGWCTPDAPLNISLAWSVGGGTQSARTTEEHGVVRSKRPGRNVLVAYAYIIIRKHVVFEYSYI